MLDLDDLKHINDTHGHKMGDTAIIATAGVLRDRLRHSDSVARIGGDEFAVLLVNVSVDHALALAEELRAALGALELRDHDRASSVTASIGIATLYGDNTAHGDPLVQADQAMYRAKAAGRDRVAR
jgi:diguanylate cyclase (GGDEF)-like protein